MKMIFILSLCSLFSYGTSARAAEVSVTMDDFDIHETTIFNAEERNQKILAALGKHNAKAALFVVGKFIQTKDDQRLLAEWPRDGHFVGNHTLNHRPYNSRLSFEEEIAEILGCENILKGKPGFKKVFRFPMLAEGDTPAKRDQLRTWLKSRGYMVGSVTIDASDWYIDQRLRARIAANPKADLTPYRDYYLSHIWDRAQYYDSLGKKVLGREIKHTLLIHFNLLNALFLDDLLSMFESKGWHVIGAEEAFRDPVFDRLPNSMPSGQSLIWALAKETGKYESALRYPGEDDVYEKPKMDKLGL